MQSRHSFALAVTTVAQLAGAACAASAQSHGASPPGNESRVTKAPGAHYQAGPLTAALWGSGWRGLWVTPVDAPVFDPARYAGGLRFDRRGGNRQSITVHFEEEKGWRGHVFRSVDKFPMQALTSAFPGTLVGRIIQDQTSMYFPAAPTLVPPLMQAIGALHVEPRLHVMGNSPRLGAVRDTVAGMLGMLELKPNEAPDDAPGFAGSRKIQDTDEFLEKLQSGHDERLDEREFLAVRLIDFLINDTDRTPDNHQWARFDDGTGRHVWRPIARDRDWAFLDARGLLQRTVIRSIYPKVVPFEPRANLEALLFSSHQLDRRLLQRLTAQDFRDLALRVQRSVTDPVIARVLDLVPAAWTTMAAPRLRTVLRARRDDLTEIAMAFYRDLASDVDIHGTKLGDRADITRHSDGRVTVTLTPLVAPQIAATRSADGRVITESGGAIERPADIFFQRTFMPGETEEVRIYLGEGDDVAVVGGAANRAVAVRVIGGKGDDVLADSTGGAHLYDSDGSNRLVGGRGTRVSTTPWNAPPPKVGLRVGAPWSPDWGGSRGWGPAFDHHAGAGLIIGGGPRWKSYGFRRLPYHWSAAANVLYGTGNGRAALTAEVDYRAENSPVAFTLAARASQLDAIRFFGYGNESPNVARGLALVEQRVISVEPAYVRRIGWRTRERTGTVFRDEDTATTRSLRTLVGKLQAGPTFSWIDPEPSSGAPFTVSGAIGAESFSVAGARASLELDRTDHDAVPTMGWRLDAAVHAYPLLRGLDAGSPFGSLAGSAAAYVPIAVNGLHLAVRAGGAVASGGTPVQFAPVLGGRSSLRGYPWRRFTGDAAANAGAELRLPVGTVNVLLNSQLGLFALADAGRVWFDGASNGGWHLGTGGGFWLAALGQAISVAYAQGEGGRLYLKAGLSY